MSRTATVLLMCFYRYIVCSDVMPFLKCQTYLSLQRAILDPLWSKFLFNTVKTTPQWYIASHDAISCTISASSHKEPLSLSLSSLLGACFFVISQSQILNYISLGGFFRFYVCHDTKLHLSFLLHYTNIQLMLANAL